MEDGVGGGRNKPLKILTDTVFLDRIENIGAFVLSKCSTL